MSRLSTLRRPGAVLLTTLACLVSVLALVTVWGRNQVLDTDRYLASVSPLATDPVIQDEVAGKVASAISSRLDAADLAQRVLPEAAGFLAGPLGDAVNGFVDRQTHDFVRTDAFATLWTEINRTGHTQLVRLLRGEQADVVVIDDGRLRLDLAPVVEAVRARLAQAGLTVVTTLPPISLVVDVADGQGIEQARAVVRHLDLLAVLLPVLAVTLLLAAVLLGRPRWTTGAAALVALTWAMVLTRSALALGAGVAASHVPARVATAPAVHVYYDRLTSLLQRGTVLVGVVCGLVAAAMLAGAGVVAVRRGRGRGRPDLRRETGLLALGLGGVALLLWPAPGTGTVLLLLLATGTAAVVGRRLVSPGGRTGPVLVAGR